MIREPRRPRADRTAKGVSTPASGRRCGHTDGGAVGSERARQRWLTSVEDRRSLALSPDDSVALSPDDSVALIERLAAQMQ